MAARLTLPRTAAWVWHGEPRSIFGLGGAVRCASGTSGTARSGFSYADNFHAWLQARAGGGPWSWFGPPHSADGEASADALAAIAPGQQVYVVEVGPETPPAQVGAFAAGCACASRSPPSGSRAGRPGPRPAGRGPLGRLHVEAFDFGLPQV